MLESCTSTEALTTNLFHPLGRLAGLLLNPELFPNGNYLVGAGCLHPQGLLTAEDVLSKAMK